MSALSTRPRTVARTATGTGATLALATVALAATGTAGHAADYTVQEGDTLTSIARRAGTDVARIAADNALADPSRVRAGQVLRLPEKAAPAPAPAASAATYTVRSGDTVSAVAARHGTSVAAIVAANGLDARAFVRAGQVLTIPGATGAPAPGATPAAAGGAYTVRSGDTVSAIAARHGTTVQAVVAANGLDARATIRAGQTLTVPGAATPAAPPAAPAATGASHTVRAGDTVSALAARHGTTVAAVVAANGLDARATIRTGQTLTIPGAATPAAPATQLVGNTFAGRTYAPQVVDAANQNKATLLATGAPSRAAMQAKVAATAVAMGVDPALAQAVAHQESGFDHTSVSPANAIGTMQVIPSSGEWASQLVGRDLNLLDPDDNVVAGVAILRSLVRTSGDDLPTAIASYYQGASSVKRNGMFSDTRRYVANVQTLMTRFR
ncbi:LysM peptidoglycan-binding domain-containing protein [Cellulomonas wangsupingiae]|uniref:LysM peptidoglycan-binding domain-containing protein n=1 Tax=Cellulomonas wangsupingiae TaxID=2968085 RepID=A0ABY5K3B9_9CELL|nr:LysM peptidoglycan-binding domain-containing protein [Cellulomonas wangsupingiae]MCC2333467.1 LysM peptidoglycan-binding domain-containing protein [Cellulomonas wangsupingiae]UUI63652.1 LysM peptidoglycan-binding domain-containing protein [Cellulomonas wangsupingiae]